MIIRFPTGFYPRPAGPSDPRNVTYTISSGDPPRSPNSPTLPQLPAGIARLGGKVSIFRDRSTYGKLTYSVNRSSPGAVTPASKSLEVGAVLGFETDSLPLAVPKLVADKFEIMHDQGLLTLTSFGLTAEQADEAVAAADSTFRILTDRLNALRAGHTQATDEVSGLRAKLSESARARLALSVASLTDLVAALDVKIASMQADLTIAVARTNSLAAESDLVADQLRQLAVLVR